VRKYEETLLREEVEARLMSSGDLVFDLSIGLDRGKHVAIV